MTALTLFNLQVELTEIAIVIANCLGWLPLGDAAYLYVGDCVRAGSVR